MTLMYQNLTPGQQASRESVEKRLLWGPLGWFVVDHVVLSSTCVDARSTVTTELLPGLVLGKITSSGEYVNYSATATDGSQIAQGILAHAVNMLDSGGTARDQLAVILISGAVKNAETGGLDQFSRSHFFGRIVFDDDYLGNSAGWRDVVAKTADYTVVAGDNNRIFTTRGAAGAVNFTLPTLAKGLRFRFFNEADQNMTVTSAAADTMVVFNDLAADSIAFSTAAEKIGGSIEVFANDNASKWLVFVNLGAETQTPTIAT